MPVSTGAGGGSLSTKSVLGLGRRARKGVRALGKYNSGSAANLLPTQRALQLWLDNGSGFGLQEGQGCDFDPAKKQYLFRDDTGAGDKLRAAALFSWSFWAYFDTVPGAGQFQNVLGKWDGNTKCEYLFYMADDGPHFAISTNGTTGTEVDAIWGATLAAGGWHHFGGYVDDVNNVLAISIDNGAFVTNTFSGTVFTGTGSFYIGRAAAVNYMDGIVQYARRWDRLLTTDEWNALYQNGDGLPDYFLRSTYTSLLTGLVCQYDLCETLTSTTQAREDIAEINGLGLTPNHDQVGQTNPVKRTAHVRAGIRSWNDRSTNLNHANQADDTLTLQLRPLRAANYSSTVNYYAAFSSGAGERSVLASALALGDTHRLFILCVLTTRGAAANSVIVGNASGEHGLLVTQTALSYKPAGVTAVTTAYVAQNDYLYLVEVQRQGTGVQFQVDGVNVGTALTLGSNGALTLSSLAAYSDGSNGTNNYILAVLCYNDALSVAEINQTRRYLNAKFGLSVPMAA